MKMSKLFAIGAGAGLLAMAAPAVAGPYNVNLTVGSGSVTGTITTDGTIGVLTAANITGWSLLLNDGTTSFQENGRTNASLAVVGSDFTATASGLFFNFADTSASNYVNFQAPSQGSGVDFFCFSTLTTCTGSNSAGLFVRATGTTQFSARTTNAQIATVGTPVVPEPATWGLMVLGFGAVGYSLRRRVRISNAQFDAKIKRIADGAAA